MKAYHGDKTIRCPQETIPTIPVHYNGKGILVDNIKLYI